MFNLEEQITEWRRKMLAAGINGPIPLDELESHLREEIERQTKSGLNEQAAFECSILQIGHAAALKTEFEKTESYGPRERKIARFFLALAALTFSVSGTFGLSKAEMTTKERLLGFTAITISVLSLLGGRYVHQLFPVFPRWRVRFAIQFAVALSAVIWMMIYAYIILPRCNFTMGQLVVATLWAMTPWAIVGGFMNGMDEAVYRRNTLVDS
jgi:hypothetical protein